MVKRIRQVGGPFGQCACPVAHGGPGRTDGAWLPVTRTLADGVAQLELVEPAVRVRRTRAPAHANARPKATADAVASAYDDDRRRWVPVWVPGRSGTPELRD